MADEMVSKALTIEEMRAAIEAADRAMVRDQAFAEIARLNGGIDSQIKAGKAPNASPTTIATAERLAAVAPIGVAIAAAFAHGAVADDRLLAIVKAFKGLSK